MFCSLLSCFHDIHFVTFHFLCLPLHACSRLFLIFSLSLSFFIFFRLLLLSAITTASSRSYAFTNSLKCEHTLAQRMSDRDRYLSFSSAVCGTRKIATMCKSRMYGGRKEKERKTKYSSSNTPSVSRCMCAHIKR